MKNGGKVQGEHVIPPIDGKLGDGGDVLDAGVVHEDIHTSEDTLREPDKLMNLCGSGEIGSVEPDIDMVLLGQPRSNRLDRGGVTEPVEHDATARQRKLLGNSQADAAG